MKDILSLISTASFLIWQVMNSNIGTTNLEVDACFSIVIFIAIQLSVMNKVIPV